MAIAITPFTALCGFRPVAQIAKYLTLTPEFAALVPSEIIKDFTSIAESSPSDAKAVLKQVFQAVMTADEDRFKAELRNLVHRYTAGKEHREESSVKDLVLSLNEQYPDDIGVFCAFMLNFMELKPGEAIFLGAGEPHAYVSGGAAASLCLEELDL